ncbi:hypothetical protein FISHEDRAFT_71077 [Fistulina hepatica ATCC 64428]|nr:hypothetical protein FISHEDRAFT_71077 [Fistulina hepatica ATCC 64428]
MSSSATRNATAVPFRLSASLVIVNERNEILLVQRNPKSRFFAGVHVFPGGNFEAEQDDSRAMTAIRETFEESGLLIASAQFPASSKELSVSVLENARREIYSKKTTFKSFLGSHGLVAQTNALHRFTEWTTPAGSPRRYRTQFYVTFLRNISSIGFSSGGKYDQLPKPDGGQEVISARFIHPKDALTEFKDGKITLMPPQFYILHTLTEILTTRSSTPDQIVGVYSLSKGGFGSMSLNPRPLPAADENGYTVLTYEGDCTRGGPPERLHRALVKFGEGGQSITELTLLRNFSIWDANAFPLVTSKL